MPTPSIASEEASTPHLPTRPFHYQTAVLHCDGVSLADLAAQHGTPLYVYSAAHVLYRLRLFREAFAHRSHTICYAVKANSSLALLRLLGEQGAGFDIVSGGELERVRRAYAPALEKVVFSGVGKQPWEIDDALRSNILLFNVESASEVDLLAERARLRGVRARFALRVNPNVAAETHPYISTGLREHKFGIDIAGARAIYRAAAALPSLDAAGVSVHIGSQIQSVAPFAAALTHVASLLADLTLDGHNIRYVDVGGGLGVEYGPVQDLDPATQVRAYADALDPVLSSLEAHLLLEPGRFLVAQAGALLTRVLNVKHNGDKTFVVTDAGMNDLIRPSLYQAHHEILPVVEPPTPARHTVDVVGPVCESGDFFARGRDLPPMATGDLALLLDAGAYGMSLASNYNTRPRPAEILVHRGVARIIRRRETLDDLLTTEVLA